MKILLVDFYKLKSKILSEIVPISDFWFPKSDWPQSILIIQGFQWKPITGGLPPPVESLTAVGMDFINDNKNDINF